MTNAAPQAAPFSPRPRDTDPLRLAVTQACRPPEPEALAPLLAQARLPAAMAQDIQARALRLAQGLRQREHASGRSGLVQGLLQRFALSSQEGVALMCLAEALLRIPDYSLRRWDALTRFVDDGQLPVDNNWIENQIRPIAIGRNNWLFAGILRAGQRAAAVMSLIQSARMNGHDPYVYLKDVLTRLPTHKASRIVELLPHRWKPADA